LNIERSIFLRTAAVIILCGMNSPFASANPVSQKTSSFRLEDGVPVAECSFEGKKSSLGCTIDTGSNGSTLPPDLFLWSQAYSSANSSKALMASGTKSECITLNLTSFTIEDLPLNPHAVDRCTNSSHGIIGVNALEGHAWRFDFKNHEMQLEEFLTSPNPQPLRRDQYHFAYLPMGIGASKIFALFDTGVTSDGLVDPEFVKAHPASFHFVGQISAQDPSGTWAKYDTYEVKSIVVGEGYRLENVTLAVMDQPEMWQVFNRSGAPIVLGMGIIGRFIWHLDFNSNIWIIE
jgi:hypothetical protein